MIKKPWIWFVVLWVASLGFVSFVTYSIKLLLKFC